MKKSLISKRGTNNGITLIALVITIIVLLILAGISIATLTGENGVLTQANNAKNENAKSQLEEEIKLAIGALKIEESTREMTQEEKRKFLEDELKKQQIDATVSIDGTGFLASNKGYEFEIDSNYNVKEPFNAEEWDKTATSDDYFEWDEAGTTIMGYKDTLAGNEKIRIPSKCIAIKTDSVWNNNDSTRSVISGGVKKIELPDTITEIGDYAFAQFKDLVSINIPRKVTTIGRYAFIQCSSLQSVEIPNSVTSIESSVFYYCTSLESIKIPDSVTSIGDAAFLLCTSLESVKIPDSVTSIGNAAFRSCTSLESVTIPDSVTSIGVLAFSDVPHIYYNGTATGSPWGALAMN